jgi:hypothetical protein
MDQSLGCRSLQKRRDVGYSLFLTIKLAESSADFLRYQTGVAKSLSLYYLLLDNYHWLWAITVLVHLPSLTGMLSVFKFSRSGMCQLCHSLPISMIRYHWLSARIPSIKVRIKCHWSLSHPHYTPLGISLREFNRGTSKSSVNGPRRSINLWEERSVRRRKLLKCPFDSVNRRGERLEHES